MGILMIRFYLLSYMFKGPHNKKRKQEEEGTCREHGETQLLGSGRRTLRLELRGCVPLEARLCWQPPLGLHGLSEPGV